MKKRLARILGKRRQLKRARVFEVLERREMLTAAVWNNPQQPFDVNGDQGIVSPIDALIVINELNQSQLSDPRSGQLPKQIESATVGPFVDVSCDGHVSSLDALLVINYLNSNATDAGSGNGSGTHSAVACSPQLAEGTDFATELTRSLTIPASPSAVQVLFQTPQFDTASSGSIRDAFEIEITDTDGNQLATPYLLGRDASFNWSEGLDHVAASGVTFATGPLEGDLSVTVDVSSVPADTEILATVRLVNNDQDDGSSVVVRGFELVPASDHVPNAVAPPPRPTIAYGDIDFAALVDLTGSFVPSYGRTTLSGQNNELITELTVTNESELTVTGNLIVAIDRLSQPDAHVMHPDGFLPDGRPYFDLTSWFDQPLAPGESVTSREIRFLNNDGERFQYELQTLGVVNAAPTHFMSNPLASIEAGSMYHYRAQALDPDDQRLSYSVVVGPEELGIDVESGEVSWPTAASDVGSHSVTIRATDPFGLYVEQRFTIQVLESLQNRPPIFVSSPATDATAASGFEISTVQAGSQPVGIEVLDIGTVSNTLVTINPGTQSLSLIRAAGSSDRYELPQHLSVGERVPQGDFLRSSYNVDLGLPAYQTTSDRNRIDGVGQGDFNGDGHLDLVTNLFTQEDLPSRTFRQFLTVQFGAGDGSFAAPEIVTEMPNAADNTNYRTLSVRDFDGDGILDVYTLDATSSTSVLLRGDGQGGFLEPEIESLADPLQDFKVFDLNSDGNPDLLGRSTDNRRLGYRLGVGDGSFEPFATVFEFSFLFNSSFPGVNYDVADVNGDGLQDIALATMTDRNLRVFLGDGNLGFTESFVARVHRFPNGNAASVQPTFVEIADFSGDGQADILVGTQHGSTIRTGGMTLYVGAEGSEDFVAQVAADVAPQQPGNRAEEFAAVDIDRDGDLDLVLGTVRNAQVGTKAAVLLNRGDGTFDSYELSFRSRDESIYSLTDTESISRDVLVGDYNADGMLDIVVSNTNSTAGRDYSNLEIVFADRPGQFASANTVAFQPLGPNTSNSFFQAGDFNNDGHVDLWSPTFQGNSRTWLGRGDGTYEPPLLATPRIGNEGYFQGFVADFDQDGNQDVFWSGTNGVQGGPPRRYLVGLGNGDGTFTISFVGTDTDGPRAAQAGDFNGDGYTDIAARTFRTAVEVLLYDPANPGTFIKSASLPVTGIGVNVNGFNTGLAAADFNNDGFEDLATVDQEPGQPFKLLTFFGRGDGTFEDAQEEFDFLADPSYTAPYFTAAGDLNEDGYADLVTGESYGLSVHLNNGDGSFALPQYYPGLRTSRNYVGLHVLDFDGDDHLDILFSDSNGTNQLNFLRGRGDGSFEQRISYDLSYAGGALAIDDFDGDSKLDIVVGTGTGAPVFTTLYGARDGLSDSVTVDLNQDGHDDLFVVNADNSRIKWFLGNTLSGLDRQIDLLTDDGPVAITAADLNDEGSVELITANRAAGSVSVFRRSFDSDFERADIPVGIGPIDVVSADVSGDAFVDLLVIDDALNALWVLEGNGDTTFQDPVPVPLGDRPRDLFVGDIDDDGNQDVVVTLPETNRIQILPGLGDGGFGTPVYVSLPSSTHSVVAADWNADGHLDLATSLPSTSQVAILFGRGEYQFSSPQLITVGDTPTKLRVADADDDGRLDLLVTNRGDDTASIIFNRFDPTQIYRYDALAEDPDGDLVNYTLVQSPGGMILNSANGSIQWAPSAEQIGKHHIVLEADDGNGGVATQSFSIEVEPARRNQQPLITTTAPQKLFADEEYRYQVAAHDPDGHPIRHRLLEGPADATLHPTTGELTWPKPDAALSLQQSLSHKVVVPPSESLQSPSVTAETWFQFATVQTQILISSGRDADFGRIRVSYQLALISSQLQAVVSDGTGDSVAELNVPFAPEIGRWYHLAMTFNDATNTLRLFIDGELVAEQATAVQIVYAENNWYVGRFSGFSNPNGAIDNTRIWNVARTPEQIREGMTRIYDNQPDLVLDFRYERGDSYSVLDHSAYRNDGVRTSNNALLPQLTPGLSFEKQSFLVGVEDGRGGYDQQRFEVEYSSPLRSKIVGTVFVDDNQDGLKQPDEPVLSGALVYVDLNGNQFADPAEPQSMTDESGAYAIDRLLADEYELRIDSIAGFVATDAKSVLLGANEERDVDFALLAEELSQIRGRVTSEEDLPISYWRVFADLDGDRRLADDEPFASTDRHGNYVLAGLPAAQYSVVAEQVPGWNSTEDERVVLGEAQIISEVDFVVAPGSTLALSGLRFLTTPNADSNSTTGVVAHVGETFRYQAIASGFVEGQVRYSLRHGPAGMLVDADSGLVVWQPRSGSIGTHNVLIQAVDATGGEANQNFLLRVVPANSPPVITSNPPTQAYVDLPLVYQLAAQDAETRALSYRLLSGPSSAAIEPETGRLDWTPSSSDVGQVLFEVAVEDEQGLRAHQTIPVNVLDQTPDLSPFQFSTPRPTAAANQPYRAKIDAFDRLGHALSLVLVDGPDGMSVSDQGNISWTPQVSDIGTTSVTVEGTDRRGESEPFEFAIEVAQWLQNDNPVFASEPTVRAVAEQPYVYAPHVLDADADQLSFELLQGPHGMSVNPKLGELFWLPSRDVAGEHEVTLRVTDIYGGTAQQQFTLRVQRSSGPPAITSVPPTEAAVGDTWLYTVEAIDPENNPLTYAFLDAPVGATIDPNTGEAAWTPQADQIGQQTISIQVTDGVGGASTQSFSILTRSGAPNRPPVLASEPSRFTSAQSQYRYQILATDPEGQSITYSLGRGPIDMTVGASTGLVSWTPAQDEVGKHIVTVLATDAQGGTAIQSFELDVIDQNSPPVFVNPPTTLVFAGEQFRSVALAQDPDFDPVRYELVNGPASMPLDAFGLVQWRTSVADIGTHPILIRATDPRGGIAELEFELEVRADVVPPRVVVNGTGRRLPWQGPLSFFVSASDNVGVESLDVTVDDQPFTIDANGMGFLSFEDWGLGAHRVQAIATDAAGNSTTAFGVVEFCDPCGSGSGGVPGGGVANPLAEISAPTAASSVTGLVTVRGTAAVEDFASYKLFYRRWDQAEFREILSSNTSVTNGDLGVWDTSLLENDEYVLRLEVRDTNNRVAVDDVQVGLSGELKLGNFRLSFVDMTLPVAGFPIEVIRTYDTLRADRDGDFGFGWRLEYRDTDLRVGLPASGLEDIGIFTPMRPGVKIYLTLPGQGRMGWTFTPDIRVLPGFGNDNLVLAAPRFTPDPGNTATLSAGTGQLFVNEFGELFATGNQPWNPASPEFGGGYTVRTKDGNRFFINGISGELERVADRHGNALVFSESEIANETGDIRVQIERDMHGRIVSIEDPAGASVTYEYASNGDLVASVDREGNRTLYEYRAAPQHYLDTVIDPLGRAGVRSEYDDEGRLITLIDAAGNRFRTSYDPDSSLVTTIDALGNPTVTEYDNRGNVLAVTDPLGAITRYTYDANNYVTSTTDALGQTTAFTLDGQGNVLAETDNQGFQTTRTINADGNPLAEVSREGRVTTYEYDSTGTVRTVNDAIGSSSSLRHDEKGQLKTLQSVAGLELTTEYDASGNRSSWTDVFGNAWIANYDSLGRLESAETQLAPGLAMGHARSYDSEGRVLTRTDAAGNLTRFQYDAAGNMIRVTDPLGKETTYEYDALAQLIKTTFPDGSTTENEYDAIGNVVSFTDEDGHTTRFQYDAAGRSVATIFPDATPNTLDDNPRTFTEYDLLGRVVAETDALGNRETTEYQQSGLLVVRTDALGSVSTARYSPDRLLVQTTDPLNRRTSYEYDDAGREIRRVFADGSEFFQEYNSLGQVVLTRDEIGNEIRRTYAANGQLMSVTDALGSVTRYEYDSLGNMILQTDANGNQSRYEYDLLGREVRRTLPGGQTYLTEYDALGRVISETNPNGETLTYEYDQRDRLIQKNLPSGASTEFTYTGTGNLSVVVEARGTTTLEYDEVGRLIKKTEPDGQQLVYAYDLAGRQTSVASLAGTTRYEYDAVGRLVKVVDHNDRETSYTYNAAGELNTTQMWNGVTEEREYDARGRLIGQAAYDANSVRLTDYRYDLDATGRLVSRVETDRRVDYMYDAANRIVKEQIFVSEMEPHVIEYIYDAVGNRLAKNDSIEGNTTYGYDENDRLTHSSAAGQLTTYTYDAAGALVTRESNGQTTTNVWDAEGRLLSTLVETPGSSQLEQYEYDWSGQRTKVVRDGNEVRYLQDLSGSLARPLAEYDAAGGLLAAYTNGLQRISESRGDEVELSLADRLGSVRMILDEAGAIVATLDYDAFGNFLQSMGSVDTDLRLNGEPRSRVSGFDYLRARYYDPQTGRFLSQDPFAGLFADPVSRHRYLYAANDPVNATDPSGRATLPNTLLTISLFSLGIGTSAFLKEKAVGKTNDVAFDAAIDAIQTTLIVGAIAAASEGIAVGLLIYGGWTLGQEIAGATTVAPGTQAYEAAHAEGGSLLLYRAAVVLDSLLLFSAARKFHQRGSAEVETARVGALEATSQFFASIGVRTQPRFAFSVPIGRGNPGFGSGRTGGAGPRRVEAPGAPQSGRGSHESHRGAELDRLPNFLRIQREIGEQIGLVARRFLGLDTDPRQVVNSINDAFRPPAE